VTALKEEEWLLCMISFFYFEVITFVVISFLIGLFLEVLSFAIRVVVGSIISMMTVVLAFIWIASVASVVVGFLGQQCQWFKPRLQWQEDEPSSSLMAVSSTWAYQGHRPLCRQSGTAWLRLWAKEGPWKPFYLFLQA
jgi:hypothetical protein